MVILSLANQVGASGNELGKAFGSPLAFSAQSLLNRTLPEPALRACATAQDLLRRVMVAIGVVGKTD
eukprot:CAMPEP_0206486700 /NCGR_PEP_ID=MMETSP0324_2-20121206/41187_1 /ASSEMBLY_ACC=CAM_ASM_000836 /TAXON_ID=2866 /ORGANISM="Crypthecodinium cohnii, Strain Seligo" /LENGTH=66 /DNA_ID=CAMNT_0053965011 /DNA_START=337 /DNA_END=537 /DNA_ORIENTATION=+